MSWAVQTQYLISTVLANAHILSFLPSFLLLLFNFILSMTQDHEESLAQEEQGRPGHEVHIVPYPRFCNFLLHLVLGPFRFPPFRLKTFPHISAASHSSALLPAGYLGLTNPDCPSKAKWRDVGAGSILGRASSQALCTGLAARCPMVHCKGSSDGTGKEMPGGRQL